VKRRYCRACKPGGADWRHTCGLAGPLALYRPYTAPRAAGGWRDFARVVAAVAAIMALAGLLAALLAAGMPL
jgi:hypothetical protein